MRRWSTLVVSTAISFVLVSGALAQVRPPRLYRPHPAPATYADAGAAGRWDPTVQSDLLGQPATIGALPRVIVGRVPQAAAFDPATGTVYVANSADGTLSVV